VGSGCGSRSCHFSRFFSLLPFMCAKTSISAPILPHVGPGRQEPWSQASGITTEGSQCCFQQKNCRPGTTRRLGQARFLFAIAVESSSRRSANSSESGTPGRSPLSPPPCLPIPHRASPPEFHRKSTQVKPRSNMYKKPGLVRPFDCRHTYIPIGLSGTPDPTQSTLPDHP
jgi:hypothetical protein